MPFDRDAEFQAQLAHLMALAAVPGFQAHAWARAKALDADQLGLYAGMVAAVRAAATGQAAPSVCAPPPVEKPL